MLAIAVSLVAGAGCSQADDDASSADQALTRPRIYLALGDSIAFGADPNVPRFTEPSGYRAYPESVAKAIDATVVNAACPGQMTSGYLSRSGPDLACFKNLDDGIPLKVRWDAPTQRDFAIRTLRSGADVRLVTLQLGANDLVSTMVRCGSVYAGCRANERYTEVPGALLRVKANVRRILVDIRSVYRGPLVVVNYYSPNYDDFVTTSAIRLLNGALRSEAEKEDIHGFTADAFTEFQRLSEKAKGDICGAGLLARNPDCDALDARSPTYPRDYCASALRVDPRQVPCDSHPSQAGHAAISAAVLKVLGEGGVDL